METFEEVSRMLVDDGFEVAERRLADEAPQRLSAALARLTDDEVALLAVWVQHPESAEVPRDLAARFADMLSDLSGTQVSRLPRRAELYRANQEGEADPDGPEPGDPL